LAFTSIRELQKYVLEIPDNKFDSDNVRWWAENYVENAPYSRYNINEVRSTLELIKAGAFQENKDRIFELISRRGNSAALFP
jgi:hypothetical protein